MSLSCFKCHKGKQKGKKIARARQGLNYRSPKIFKPNLHPYRMIVNGRKQRVMLCTKCLRLVKGKVELQRKKAQELKLAAQVAAAKKKKIEKTKPARKAKVSPRQSRQTKKEAKAAKDRRTVEKTKKEAANLPKK